MNPGETARPVASITRVADGVSKDPHVAHARLVSGPVVDRAAGDEHVIGDGLRAAADCECHRDETYAQAAVPAAST